MVWDEELPSKAGTEIVVGENLERSSIEELTARVAALKGEIDRVEAEIARKRKIGDAAAAVFKD